MHFVLRGYGTGSIDHTRHIKQLRKLRNEFPLVTAMYIGLPPGTVFTLALNGTAGKTSKLPINSDASICLTSEICEEFISFSAVIIKRFYLESMNDGLKQKTRVSYDFELGFQPKCNANSMFNNIISLKAALGKLLGILASHHFEGLK